MRTIILLPIFIILSCVNQNQGGSELGVESLSTTDSYMLFRAPDPRALLVLFPGGGQKAAETNLEFPIPTKANAKGVSVLMMNFNLHLFISEDESRQLTAVIEELIVKEGYEDLDIVIGGMSMGGNVALSLSNYLIKSSDTPNLKGVFIVDSPIDLHTLYKGAKLDLARKDLSKERLEEPRWIAHFFEKEFGDSDSTVTIVQDLSLFTLSTKSDHNIRALKDIDLRFYTEPDTSWWETNRNTSFENTNSHVLQNASRHLKSKGWEKLKLIQTENRGYRAEGERHPHSWSIVDKDELIRWILEASNSQK